MGTRASGDDLKGNYVELTDIDLRGYGRFLDAPASFECTKIHLPSPWDYVYTNGQVLVRIRADGSGYCQVNPPEGVPLLGGPPLLHREGGHSSPTMLTWIVPDGEPLRAFTNFGLPAVPVPSPLDEPEGFSCRFEPACATWNVRQDDWAVRTVVMVPPEGAGMIVTVSITNAGPSRRGCSVMPAIKPHLASLTAAPWDVAFWYQTSAYCRIDGRSAFWVQTRDAGGRPAARMHAGIISDFAADTVETAYEAFIGNGSWSAPEALWRGKLRQATGETPVPLHGQDARATHGRVARATSRARRPCLSADYAPYGRADGSNASTDQPILAAMARRVELEAGATFEFTIVYAKLTDRANGRLPHVAELKWWGRYLDAGVRAGALDELKARYDALIGRRRLDLPDRAMSRYVNEWMPMQAYWVAMLDRGWPGGFRGTRDAAQDATSFIPMDARLARARLIEIAANQRTDGYFPRLYSATDKASTLDIMTKATHVDAGAFTWELLREYVCWTRDFAVLDERVGWIDARRKSTLLEHGLAILDYYLAAGNLGRHGLCKIRGGDWNDSINLAGVLGKGESVMVSCQVVLALEQAAELLAHLDKGKRRPRFGSTIRRLARAAAKMRANLLRHALNKQGYFNGVFNDAGKWIFSPRDPDGQKRVSGPANSFAIIAGLARGKQRKSVIEALDWLKGPFGWRLFYPAICSPPIPNLGRLGQGDLSPGIGENGTVYNHGAHGFLGRAAWSAGAGDMLYQVMRHMFPYDQQTHDVDVAKTAPYGLVNHWKEAFGVEGVGGDTFLTGSIATAIRNAYEGFAGFRPGLEHVVIDPCISGDWKSISYEVGYLGGCLHVKVANPKGVQCGVARLTLDGREIADRVFDARLERNLAAIPVELLVPGKDHAVEVTLG